MLFLLIIKPSPFSSTYDGWCVFVKYDIAEHHVLYVVCTWLRSNMFLSSGYVRADSGSAVNNNPGYHQGISWPTDVWLSNKIKDIYLLRLGWRAVWGLIWGRRNSQFLYKGSFHGTVGPSTFWEGATRKKEPPPPPSSNHSTATPLWGFFTLISGLPILSSWEGVSLKIFLCIQKPPLLSTTLSSFLHCLTLHSV